MVSLLLAWIHFWTNSLVNGINEMLPCSCEVILMEWIPCDKHNVHPMLSYFSNDMIHIGIAKQCHGYFIWMNSLKPREASASVNLGNSFIIGSGNGWLLFWHHVVTWTNALILPSGHLGTDYCDIWSLYKNILQQNAFENIQNVHFTQKHHFIE